MGLDPNADDVVQVAIKTLRANLRRLRAGTVRGDFAGYFYRSLINQFAIHLRRVNGSLYNWLDSSVDLATATQEVVAVMQEAAVAVYKHEGSFMHDGTDAMPVAMAMAKDIVWAVAHQEAKEACGGYEERQERRIADDPELLSLLRNLEDRKRMLRDML